MHGLNRQSDMLTLMWDKYRPKDKSRKERIRTAYFKHGQDTLEAKAGRGAKSVMFRYLTDLGNYCNMFYKQLKTQGRPPAGYAQLNLSDPEQLALAIIKTLPKQ